MTSLEDLTTKAAVRGILPDQVVTVVNVQWFGSAALELTYIQKMGDKETIKSLIEPLVTEGGV